MTIRDRVRELRRVRAAELLPHARNWRRHPPAQAAALRGLLNELGYAAALIARETADGKLQLIDGHLRAETTPDTIVPVLVVDLSEAEADKLLLTLDSLTGMAEADATRVATAFDGGHRQRGRRGVARAHSRDGGLPRPYTRRCSRSLRSIKPPNYG